MKDIILIRKCIVHRKQYRLSFDTYTQNSKDWFLIIENKFPG